MLCMHPTDLHALPVGREGQAAVGQSGSWAAGGWGVLPSAAAVPLHRWHLPVGTQLGGSDRLHRGLHAHL